MIIFLLVSFFLNIILLGNFTARRRCSSYKSVFEASVAQAPGEGEGLSMVTSLLETGQYRRWDSDVLVHPGESTLLCMCLRSVLLVLWARNRCWGKAQKNYGTYHRVIHPHYTLSSFREAIVLEFLTHGQSLWRVTGWPILNEFIPFLAKFINNFGTREAQQPGISSLLPWLL